MGKKGKKSRRQAKKVDTDKIIIDNIRKRIHGFLELSVAYVDKHLYSDAVTHFRVALEFLKKKHNVLQNIEQGLGFLCYYTLNLCNYLIWLELRCCNFEAVMEFYDSLKYLSYFSNLKIGKFWLEVDDLDMQMIQSCYELALVATKDSNSDTTCICEFFLRQMRTAPVDAIDDYLEMTVKVVNVLRVAKKFNEVIDFDKKLLLLPNFQESLEVNISLFVSYIERYREEYHLRSKRDDYFLVKKKLDHIRDTYEHDEFDTCILTCKLLFELAFAQWTYLCHKLNGEEHKRLCYELSIRHVETIVENEWNYKDNCSICGQAPTKDEVKFVCSGCHVACYCSIDHQRMNWRKYQFSEICIGHQTFCPVLKAYRKWKAATNESTIDEEKQGRMRRRFERECLDFLAYGLRLEKKCFELEDVRTE